MIHFMEHTATTAIHAKKWALLRWKIRQVQQVIDTELSAYQKVIDETL